MIGDPLVNRGNVVPIHKENSTLSQILDQQSDSNNINTNNDDLNFDESDDPL